MLIGLASAESGDGTITSQLLLPIADGKKWQSGRHDDGLRSAGDRTALLLHAVLRYGRPLQPLYRLPKLGASCC